jgi:hypothetical protein
VHLCSALEYGETDEPILNEETAVPPAVEDDSNNETVQLQEPIEKFVFNQD